MGEKSMLKGDEGHIGNGLGQENLPKTSQRTRL